MRDFRRKYCDKLRQKWLDSLCRCNSLFACYNESCDIIAKLEEKPSLDEIDVRLYKQEIDNRLVLESELVSARDECRRNWHDYYFQFPFLAAFENLGGDTD